LDYVTIPGYPDESDAVANLKLWRSESGHGADLEVTLCLTTSDQSPNQNFNNQAFWSDTAASFRKLVQK
jgi:hypothetical protein